MEAVKNIGKVQLEIMNKKGKGLLEGFTQDPSGGGNYKYCIEILINKEKKNYCYNGINFSEYDSKNITKYLYRKGASRGADITPTAKITDVKKTLSNKIIKAVDDAINFSKNQYNDEVEMLKNMYKVLMDNEDIIVKDIEEKIKDIPKKEGAFITTTLLVENESMYIGDFQLFKDKIVNEALKKFHYSETYKKDVYKNNAVCSLCEKQSDDIFGLVGVFPFYTIDKPGYISSGFDYENAWRNYPVCKECAISLELGKRYIEENLTFSFYGRRYYLIPKPIYEKSLEETLKKYRILKSKETKEVNEKYSNVEENVMKFLSKEENMINFDIMFYEKNNAALNILLNIEDVSPTRFKKIFGALDDIRDMEFFKGNNIKVGFQLINNVFTSDKYNKYFFEIIDKVISNRKLEYKFLMQFFNTYIIDAYKRMEKDEVVKDKDSYYTATFRVMGFLYFIYKLSLFKNKGGEENMSIDKQLWSIKNYASIKDIFEDYFEKSNPFFDIPDKKAVFLIGFATKKLLNIQYAKEQRKPFLNRLKGLKLGKRDMRRLIPEIQSKLAEYKRGSYAEVFEEICIYMIESKNLKQLSELDIPFYFSMGMNMDKNFELKEKKNDNSEGNEE